MFLSHFEVTTFFSEKFFFFFIEELELNLFISKFKGVLRISQPEKKANILWHPHWFPWEMTPDEPAQKFYTDGVSLAIDANFYLIRIKHYPDEDFDASSV